MSHRVIQYLILNVFLYFYEDLLILLVFGIILVIIEEMPKQVIVIMQENYPFGQCEEVTTDKTKVLVRKIYPMSNYERGRLLERAAMLKKLNNDHMIKIQSMLEEEDNLHFLFEYIPIKLETWISNINDQFIENFRDQLIKFSSYLANNLIKIEFQLRNIGMDQNYGAKYFLGIDFDVIPLSSREKLKSNYIREITNLFRPYIMNSTQPAQTSIIKTQKEPAKESEVRKVQDAAISPPTYKPPNKNKEKALAQYYQQVNMSVDSENQKILQEFMDVLDNDEEEEHKHNNHPPPSARSQPDQNINVRDFPSMEKKNHFTVQNAKNQSFASKNQQMVKHQSAQLSNNSFNVGQQKNTIADSKNVPSMQSMGRGRSQIKQNNNKNQIWRQSIVIQNRVKMAIQKSLVAIKRFKQIKTNTSLI